MATVRRLVDKILINFQGGKKRIA